MTDEQYQTLLKEIKLVKQQVDTVQSQIQQLPAENMAAGAVVIATLQHLDKHALDKHMKEYYAIQGHYTSLIAGIR